MQNRIERPNLCRSVLIQLGLHLYYLSVVTWTAGNMAGEDLAVHSVLCFDICTVRGDTSVVTGTRGHPGGVSLLNAEALVDLVISDHMGTPG